MSEAEKHENQVAGGYKATLHNPNVGEETKQRAQQKLHELGRTENDPPSHSASDDTKNPGNVIGGYKATLKNPNVSEEAKQRAADYLEEQGVDS